MRTPMAKRNLREARRRIREVMDDLPRGTRRYTYNALLYAEGSLQRAELDFRDLIRNPSNRKPLSE